MKQAILVSAGLASASCSLYDPAFAPPPWVTDEAPMVAEAEGVPPDAAEAPLHDERGDVPAVPPIHAAVADVPAAVDAESEVEAGYSVVDAPTAPGHSTAVDEPAPAFVDDASAEGAVSDESDESDGSTAPPIAEAGDGEPEIAIGVEAPPRPDETPVAEVSAAGSNAEDAEGPDHAAAPGMPDPVAPLRIPVAAAIPALPSADILTPSRLREETMRRDGPPLHGLRDEGFLDRLRKGGDRAAADPAPVPTASPAPSPSIAAPSRPGADEAPAGDDVPILAGESLPHLGPPSFSVPSVFPMIEPADASALRFGTSLGPPTATFDFGQP